MRGFFAKMIALIALGCSGVILLALLGGCFIPEGWQIAVAWQEGYRSWQTNIMNVNRRLSYHVVIGEATQTPALLSPNGRFAVWDNAYEIVFLDLESGVRMTLPAGTPMRWSPDSHYLAIRDRDFSSETYNGILLLPVDEAGLMTEPIPVRMMDERIRPGFVMWSPDSQKLAILTFGGLILIAGADASNSYTLFSSDSLIEAIDWSADSQKIAIVQRNPTILTASTLSWIDVESTEQETITQTILAGVQVLSWSPDGEFIAFALSPDIQRQLYIVNAITGQITGPIDHNLAASSLQWSPDSQQLLFLSWSERNLYIVDRDGSDLYRLTNSGNFADPMP